jgi:hypothetical protein
VLSVPPFAAGMERDSVPSFLLVLFKKREVCHHTGHWKYVEPVSLKSVSESKNVFQCRKHRVVPANGSSCGNAWCSQKLVISELSCARGMSTYPQRSALAMVNEERKAHEAVKICLVLQLRVCAILNSLAMG